MSLSKKRALIERAPGAPLAAIIDVPAGKPLATALYAHCFTCSKDSLAAARIGRALSEAGITCWRFDFTGLGQSQGDFSRTTLSSNIADIITVAQQMQQQGETPQLLIGHSLGGIAALFAAASLSSVRALVMVNCPPRADHVLQHFGSYLETIKTQGEAMVPIYEKDVPRRFLIRQSFVDDIRRYQLTSGFAQLQRPLLCIYAENDDLITPAQTQELLAQAHSPKQLKVIAGADHILSQRQHGLEAGQLIADWFKNLSN